MQKPPRVVVVVHKLRFRCMLPHADGLVLRMNMQNNALLHALYYDAIQSQRIHLTHTATRYAHYYVHLPRKRYRLWRKLLKRKMRRLREKTWMERYHTYISQQRFFSQKRQDDKNPAPIIPLDALFEGVTPNNSGVSLRSRR